jgi:hypothetical protein
MLGAKLILAVLAIVFFLLAGFGAPRWGWQWFGCACVVAAVFLA